MDPRTCPSCKTYHAAIPLLTSSPRAAEGSGCCPCGWSWRCLETSETSTRRISSLRVTWLDAKHEPRRELVVVRTSEPRAQPPDLDLHTRRVMARTYSCGSCGQRFRPMDRVALDWDRDLIVHAGGCPKPIGAELEEVDARSLEEQVAASEHSEELPDNHPESAEQQVAAAERGHELHARLRLEQAREWMARRTVAAPPSQPQGPAKPASGSGRQASHRGLWRAPASWALWAWRNTTACAWGVVAFLGMAWRRSPHEHLPGEYQDR